MQGKLVHLITLPLIVCLVGLLIYVTVRPESRWREIGRLTFLAGLLTALWWWIGKPLF